MLASVSDCFEGKKLMGLKNDMIYEKCFLWVYLSPVFWSAVI